MARKLRPPHHGDAPVERFWTSADVIECLKISESKFAYLRAMGKMAPPVAQLGRVLLFHPREVKEWACAGGPSVTEWEATKKRRGWHLPAKTYEPGKAVVF
jgi:hypothetical protein